MKVPKVFISHISQERKLALRIDQAIRDWVGDSRDKVEIFTSTDKSDPETTKSYASIELGDDWFEKILEKLPESNTVLIVATPLSLQQTWINFEIGAAWVLRKLSANTSTRVFACCALGMSKGMLPSPLNRIESADLRNPEDVKRILTTIGDGPSINTLNNIAYAFVNDIRQIETEYRDLDVSGELSTWMANAESSLEYTTPKAGEAGFTYSSRASMLAAATEVLPKETIADIIQRYLSVPYDHFSDSMEERYIKRYEYGRYLSRLNALDDRQTELTDNIKRHDGSTFRAMKLLVTRRLFEKYSSSKGKFPQGIDDAYYPFCLPITETDSWNFGNWWDEVFMVFIERLKQSSDLAGMGLRLPTFSEWKLLAKKDSGWDYDAVRECNLRIEYTDQRELSTVGVFPGGTSDVGCHDVIGNVWELCLEKPDQRYPTLIAGWSYEDDYQPSPEWWCTSVRMHPIITRYIGFRLITVF